MFRDERTDSLLVALQSAQDQVQGRMWTALPAEVATYNNISFNPAEMTVVAQPTVQAQYIAPTSQVWQNITLPLCLDCPVLFGGGGGYCSTFPLAVGDEGLLVFSSRCIDAWWQSGGVQPQAELRMHDLSDGFFVPLCFSQPKVANLTGGASTTEAQIRTLDGTIMARLSATLKQAGLVSGANSLVVDGIVDKVLVVAAGGLWVNGVLVTVP